MLHAAVAVIVENAGRAPKTHGAIIGQFSLLAKDRGDKARLLGRAFNWVENLRLTSDYAHGENPSLGDVAEAKKISVEFVAYCRSLL